MPVELQAKQDLLDTFDGKNTIENPLISPIGDRDGLKTQLEENIVEANQKAWDMEKGRESAREPLTADPRIVHKEEYSVDYYDQAHGLMKREADDDLHNQILNELVLANDMA